MQYWTAGEVGFITDRLSLGTKEIYEAFCEEFGGERGYNSIQKKTKKLRDAHSEEPVETDAEEENWRWYQKSQK